MTEPSRVHRVPANSQTTPTARNAPRRTNFRDFTPLTITDITDPPETLPLSFLTDQAFSYLLPGILRWLPRTGPQFCVGGVLFHVKTRLHTLNPEQRAVLRDLIYIVYARLKSEIESTPFDYPTIWRILNELDRSQ